MNRPKPGLEDILDAVMLDEVEPSYAALTRWSERYPEHREALAEFFATWAMQAELPQETEINEAIHVNLAVSHALDILHRRADKATPKTLPATCRLISAAQMVGITDEQLATLVGLDRTIIQKLDLHRITNTPGLCIERLGTALNMPRDQIQEMATGPPLMGAGVRHKAKRTPSPATESFENAIRASSLSEEDKRFWLELIEAEREIGKE